MKNNIYFKDRQNNDYTKYTKEEIRDIVNPFIPETFIPILKDMNYPYFESDWGNTLSKSYRSFGGTKTVIGRYIFKMQLPDYKNFAFKDSQYHKELQEFSLQAYGLLFDKENRIISTFENRELIPTWNFGSKKPTEKDYKETIMFLLDELEWHHSGIKDFYLRSIKSKYNIDF